MVSVRQRMCRDKKTPAIKKVDNSTCPLGEGGAFFWRAYTAAPSWPALSSASERKEKTEGLGVCPNEWLQVMA
jgi:hypothetical protein